MTRDERKLMKAQGADTIISIQGIYANCRNVHINVHGFRLPTLCFEVGYSESIPYLKKDMRRLLLGYYLLFWLIDCLASLAQS